MVNDVVINWKNKCIVVLKKIFYLEFYCKYIVLFFYNICIKGFGLKSFKIRERKLKERN